MSLARRSRFSRYRASPLAVDDGSRRPYLPPVPLTLPPGGYDEWLARCGRTINATVQGNLNCVADVKLDAGTSTTVYDDRIGYWSVVIPVPLTATAAAAMSGIYCVPAAGSVVIHHAASAATDRDMRLAILG